MNVEKTLGSQLGKYCLFLLHILTWSVTKMKNSCFDTDFASQLTLPELPVVHSFDYTWKAEPQVRILLTSSSVLERVEPAVNVFVVRFGIGFEPGVYCQVVLPEFSLDSAARVITETTRTFFSLPGQHHCLLPLEFKSANTDLKGSTAFSLFKNTSTISAILKEPKDYLNVETNSYCAIP